MELGNFLIVWGDIDANLFDASLLRRVQRRINHSFFDFDRGTIPLFLSSQATDFIALILGMECQLALNYDWWLTTEVSVQFTSNLVSCYHGLRLEGHIVEFFDWAHSRLIVFFQYSGRLHVFVVQFIDLIYWFLCESLCFWSWFVDVIFQDVLECLLTCMIEVVCLCKIIWKYVGIVILAHWDTNCLALGDHEFDHD